ncbi:serine protease 41-like [Perognathus longimembris pacificus]|uniref:serine protease 41-like n=1 Tax=Perognathus longimembris pacificus TaxID=214514 RepID=UPI0020192E7D|nr:serine protease 41-like [Perognathus longimembris pacificus]
MGTHGWPLLPLLLSLLLCRAGPLRPGAAGLGAPAGGGRAHSPPPPGPQQEGASGPMDTKLLTSPCGHQEVRPLILGGWESVPGRWPWQALVMAKNGLFCGGSLLSRHWVLSAAHCFEKVPEVSKWTVQLGELSLKSPSWSWRAHSHKYRVKKIIVNPKARGVLNDIALVRLASSVTYNKHIQPICILSSTAMFQHRPDCWVTGWGWIQENQKLLPPYHLQEVRVTILNNSRCNELFSMPIGRSLISNDMICAGAEDGSVDTCNGDSGGPLVCEEKGRWYQVGVVSWGMGCGHARRPGVYTNVSSFFPWIQLLMSCTAPRPGLFLPLVFLALPWVSWLLCPS